MDSKIYVKVVDYFLWGREVLYFMINIVMYFEIINFMILKNLNLGIMDFILFYL